jgi:hypothetical protein
MHILVTMDKTIEFGGRFSIPGWDRVGREKGQSRATACAPEGYGGSGAKRTKVMAKVIVME